jgi:hypothetical protein
MWSQIRSRSSAASVVLRRVSTAIAPIDASSDIIVVDQPAFSQSPKRRRCDQTREDLRQLASERPAANCAEPGKTSPRKALVSEDSWPKVAEYRSTGSPGARSLHRAVQTQNGINSGSAGGSQRRRGATPRNLLGKTARSGEPSRNRTGPTVGLAASSRQGILYPGPGRGRRPRQCTLRRSRRAPLRLCGVRVRQVSV